MSKTVQSKHFYPEVPVPLKSELFYEAFESVQLEWTENNESIIATTKIGDYHIDETYKCFLKNIEPGQNWESFCHSREEGRKKCEENYRNQIFRITNEMLIEYENSLRKKTK